MTGFGRATTQVGDRRLVVEIRSVNHRGVDVKLRGRDLAPDVEHEVLRTLKAKIQRGSVLVNVVEEMPHGGAATRRLHDAASLLEKFRVEAGFAAAVQLRDVLAFAALPAAATQPNTLAWDDLRTVLAEAVGHLIQMREVEGAALRVELLRIKGLLGALAVSIADSTKDAPAKAGRRLAERVGHLMAQPGLDPGRLAQEVAVLADRIDVTEELTRLRTHLDHLASLLDEKAGGGEPAGRKIEFLAQEIAREINTTGSKVQDASISALVVQAKAELEKLREQAQNIE